MTPILLGRKGTREPYTCMVCGRGYMTKSLGICPKKTDTIGWLCDDPTCLKVANKVYKMQTKDLCRYEQVAIDDAATKLIDPLFDAMLSAMHSKGARSLDDLDEHKFKAVADEALDKPELRNALGEFLREYGAAIKRQVDNNDPPF